MKKCKRGQDRKQWRTLVPNPTHALTGTTLKNISAAGVFMPSFCHPSVKLQLKSGGWIVKRMWHPAKEAECRH